MYSLNRVELIGRIGSDDFSLGRSSKEQAVLTVSVATAEKWQSEDGSEQEHTEWHRCVFFRKCAETAARLLSKGAQIYVSGKLSCRRYTDNTGNQRYITEIIVSDFMILGSSNISRNNTDHKCSRQAPEPSAVSVSEAAVHGPAVSADPYSIDDFDGTFNL